MTRSELIAQLAERFPQLVQKDAEMAVTEILGAIHAALVHGDRIEIRGFGVFDLNHRTPRQARNPKTGEPVAVPAKWVPAFKAGKELRERVMATTSPQRLLIDLPGHGAITDTRQRESEMLFKDGIA
ncbi:MAG: integration host factor subunit beta [Betaproteobacteria bacterium]|nr:integration host factor subunit beta [Betaproteobacteria bacterium]MBK8918349.1 integration host factor subunit beta [Betaproteobacteria bacterium]